MDGYIKKSDLLKRFDNEDTNVFDMESENGCSHGFTRRLVKRVVEDAPTADVAPVVHGKWKEESPDYLDGDSVYICSVCGETWNLEAGTPQENNMNYCPNCGAKMDL